MATQTGIFICPSCQAVVKGGLNGESGVACPECDHQFGSEPAKELTRKPAKVPGGRGGGKSGSVIRDLTARKAAPVKPLEAPDRPKVAAKSLAEAKAEMSGVAGDGEVIMPDGTRRVRRRKRKKKDEKNKGLILFLLAWFCVIFLVVAMFKRGKDDNEEAAGEGPDAVETDLEARNLAVMRRLLPEIGTHFQQFLFHPTLSGREQFIDRSADLSLAFTQFYAVHDFPKPESTLRRIEEHVLSFSDDRIAIETIWEAEGGHKWGAVHVFDKTEGWKLDWENFAPYSSESWVRFRSNLGASEGEFRLLVRKRFGSDGDEKFYLNFYRAPQIFETGNEYKNTQSPEVEVVADSDLGREFLRLWEDYQEGKSPYGSILAKELDPRNHMRITVRLAWEQGSEEEDVMVLKEILGVGWFGKRIQDLHEEAVRKVTKEATGTLSETPVEDK